jgi:hypothetical protein
VKDLYIEDQPSRRRSDPTTELPLVIFSELISSRHRFDVVHLPTPYKGRTHTGHIFTRRDLSTVSFALYETPVYTGCKTANAAAFKSLFWREVERSERLKPGEALLRQ